MQDQWLSPRVRVGIIVALCVTTIVATLDFTFLDLATKGEDILVEANGVVFDVALFGVLILFLDERREAARRQKEAADERQEMIRGWHEQLQDFSGWHSEESAMRTAGLLRRLSRAKANINASNAYAKGGMLSEVHFVGADLAKADFERAVIDHAHLDGADMRFANLGRARLDSSSLVRANLYEANLTDATLTSADLSDADLEEARLAGANLSSARLRRTRLRRAYLAQADLHGADLRGCDLHGTNLAGANLMGARRRKRDPAVPGWMLTNIQGQADDAEGTLVEAPPSLASVTSE